MGYRVSTRRPRRRLPGGGGQPARGAAAVFHRPNHRHLSGSRGFSREADGFLRLGGKWSGGARSDLRGNPQLGLGLVLTIPAIPGAVGHGDTGNFLVFNDQGQFVQSVYDNTFETNSERPHLYTPGLGWESLGKPGDNNAIVTAINEVGQVLAAGLNDDNDEFLAWSYTPGVGWENGTSATPPVTRAGVT